MLPIVAFAVAVLWQLLLVGYVATSTEAAARAGSRQASLTTEEEGRNTALDALAPWLRDGSTATVDGTTTRVTVPVPILVPMWTQEGWKVTRSAEFPDG